jgi:hypothetical protein
MSMVGISVIVATDHAQKESHSDAIRRKKSK